VLVREKWERWRGRVAIVLWFCVWVVPMTCGAVYGGCVTPHQNAWDRCRCVLSITLSGVADSPIDWLSVLRFWWTLHREWQMLWYELVTLRLLGYSPL
jgi:hypothetical protein